MSEPTGIRRMRHRSASRKGRNEAKLIQIYSKVVLFNFF